MVSVIEALWRRGTIQETPVAKTISERRQALFGAYPELGRIPQDRFPHHLLIIPDGNGRWAQRHHLNTTEGHRKGKEVAVQLLRDLRPLEEVRFVTLWGMSYDNLEKRDPEEKDNLFRLFEETVRTLEAELIEENGRFVHLGRKDRIPESLRKTFTDVERDTAQNSGQTVCLAIDYGGQDQEVRIINRARQEIPINRLVTIEDIRPLRDGGGIVPGADLVIRTSGELRTSGLGWLGEQAEFVAVREFFPSVGTAHIVKGLVEYSKRDRRFGGRPQST